MDLPFISELYGKQPPEIIGELGDRDLPRSRIEGMADRRRHLSGNAGAKLSVAEHAGITRATPMPSAPSNRKTCCRVTSTPTSAHRGRRSRISRHSVPTCSVSIPTPRVAHLKKDALWSVDAGYSAEQSVAARPTLWNIKGQSTWLFEPAMNMKSPVVYDPGSLRDPDKRVVNQEQTLAAKEKQKAIKEKFKGWVFSDPERTERLVRVYNDNFNNLRPRLPGRISSGFFCG